MHSAARKTVRCPVRVVTQPLLVPIPTNTTTGTTTSAPTRGVIAVVICSRSPGQLIAAARSRAAVSAIPAAAPRRRSALPNPAR